MKARLSILLAALPGLAFGQKAESTAAPVAPLAGLPGTGQLVELTLALLAVVAVIVVSAMLMRRLGRFTGAGTGVLRVVGGVSLGARERAVLIEVGGQQLLVGVSPGSVRTLHVLDGTLTPPAATAPEMPFAERLQGLLRGAKRPAGKTDDAEGGA